MYTRTLCYPLSAINLTKKQCDNLMIPLLSYVLPAIGVCRTFPRDLIFAPTKYLGLGLKHIHTVQEITRLTDILYHVMQDSLLGSLYKTSLSGLILEIGLDSPLHSISYQRFEHVVTPSLINSTWEFLHHSQIELKHDLPMQKQRLGDRALMSILVSLEPTKDQLARLNRCRLFLKAFWLSDIVDGSGVFLRDEAWTGQPLNMHRESSWPRQGKPGPTDWALWREFLSKGILGRGGRLKYSMGLWHAESDNPWYYCKNEDALYQLSELGSYRFSHIPRSSGRPRFANCYSVSQIPPNMDKATAGDWSWSLSEDRPHKTILLCVPYHITCGSARILVHAISSTTG
jgi:hypothetical protein